MSNDGQLMFSRFIFIKKTYVYNITTYKRYAICAQFT